MTLVPNEKGSPNAKQFPVTVIDAVTKEEHDGVILEEIENDYHTNVTGRWPLGGSSSTTKSRVVWRVTVDVKELTRWDLMGIWYGDPIIVKGKEIEQMCGTVDDVSQSGLTNNARNFTLRPIEDNFYFLNCLNHSKAFWRHFRLKVEDYVRKKEVL